jgi:hypothetical protein
MAASKGPSKSFFLLSLLTVMSFDTHAEFIRSVSELNSSSTLVDFESVDVGTLGPISSDQMTVSSSNPEDGIRPQEYTQFPGIFEGHYFGLGPNDYFIDFENPVAEVGFGLFDPNYFGNIIRILDVNGNELERAVSGTDFPIEESGGFHSVYVGFVRGSNEISRVEIIHIAPEGVTPDWLALDNVSWYRSPQYRLPFGPGPFNGKWPITTAPGCGEHSGTTPEAIDYGLPEFTSVLSSEAGEVVFANLTPQRIPGTNLARRGYGLMIQIKHSNGDVSFYAHLSRAYVRRGSRVEKGQFIGLSGGRADVRGSGRSNGPHLHFEIRNSTYEPFGANARGPVAGLRWGGNGINLRNLPITIINGCMEEGPDGYAGPPN